MNCAEKCNVSARMINVSFLAWLGLEQVMRER